MDNQAKLEKLKQKLLSYTREDYEIGLPYNDAKAYASSYDEYLEAIEVVENAARELGVSDDILSTLRAAYDTTYYPYQYSYGFRDDKKYFLIPQFNASPEFEEDKYKLEIEGRSYLIDLGDYQVNSDGVFYVQPDKEPLQISDHPIVPYGVVRGLTGEENLKLWCSVFGNQSLICLKKTIAYDRRKVKALLGYSITANPQLVDYLSSVERLNRTTNPDFRVISSLTHLGWTDDTCTNFFPYDRGGYECIQNDSYSQIYDSVVSNAGTLRDWVDMVNQYRDKDHIPLRIILAASFSSVLVKPLGKLPYILHIWGQTGMGKTVALNTAASIWAKPGVEGGGFVSSLDLTPGAFDDRAQYLYSYPLCFDELQTVKNKKDMEHFVYALTEGMPRQQSASYRRGMSEQNGWSNCSITTGEQPLLTSSGPAGAMNRIIDLHYDSPLFTGDVAAIAAYCDKLFHCYNTAGSEFISYIKQEEVMSRANDLCDEYMSQFSAKGITGKQSGAAALILTADILATECIFKDDLTLEVDDLLPYLKREEEVDRGDEMHRYIIEWIALNKQALDTERALGKITVLSGQKVCCIPIEKFVEIMQRKNYDPTVYIEWAKVNGKILTEGDGHHTKRKVTINGVKNVYCVCVKYDEVETPVNPETAEEDAEEGCMVPMILPPLPPESDE